MAIQQNNDGQLRELALFAGAGGGILGGKLLGWRTVCAVERDAYAAQVLAQRQNDGILEAFPIWSDVCSFDGRPWRGIVDVISGGFPCQDISAAGKGAGIQGERSGLWKEFARIIGEVRPSYVFVENSPMLTVRGLGTVLGDLAALGFDAEWGVLSAADVGARHLRERIWIVGYSNNNGQIAAEIRGSIVEGSDNSPTRANKTSQLARPSEQYAELANTDCLTSSAPWKNKNKKRTANQPCSSGQYTINVANATSIREPRHGKFIKQMRKTQDCDRQTNIAQPVSERSKWPTEPDVGRVANGVAFRVDRLKAIGNGQVPRVAATAWQLLYERIG